MRKISVGVLSVAGLLAVVLAIAGGSASAQSTAKVVTFITDDIPGTYTVSWETQGGCDPTMRDASTSGATDPASGSYSRTVAVPAGTAPTATVADQIEGDTAEFAVVTASHCNYVWTVSFASGLPGDEGTRCIANAVGSRPSTAGPLRSGVLVVPAASTASNGVTSDTAGALTKFTFDVGGAGTAAVDADTNCDVSRKIRVTVGPTAVLDDPAIPGDQGTYTSDGRYVNDGYIYRVYDPDAGAVLSTTFTVTATPVKVPPQDAECEAVSEETKVVENGPDTRNDDRVEATLQVIAKTLEKGATCKYDVVVELPAGFTDKAPRKAPRPRSNMKPGVDPANFSFSPPTKYDGKPSTTGTDDSDPDTYDPGVATTLADCGTKVARTSDSSIETDPTQYVDAVTPGTSIVESPACPTLRVAVAERSVYITQSVVGDAGGDEHARYTLTEDYKCGIPDDLPVNLVGTGGITEIPSVTIVELRKGYFNISTAVMDPTTTDVAGRFVAPRLALNYEADPCVVEAEVSHLLDDNCSAAVPKQSADLATGVDDRGRAVMRFDITCSDDMGGGDMMGDGDDMGGDDMSDGDMMSGGDMMGPPEDVATG